LQWHPRRHALRRRDRSPVACHSRSSHP
ncbi:hypothetical protein BN1723_020861, partial [Verticillium longisporum]